MREAGEGSSLDASPPAAVSAASDAGAPRDITNTWALAARGDLRAGLALADGTVVRAKLLGMSSGGNEDARKSARAIAVGAVLVRPQPEDGAAGAP